MGRVVRNWQPDRVDALPVAPHRYVWDSADDWRWKKEYKEFMAGIPYKVGEVVMVEHGAEAKRARITDVFTDRDYYGDRIEKYRVQYETKAGLWSKSWEYVHSGFIQRGYLLAGLAPDLEGKGLIKGR